MSKRARLSEEDAKKAGLTAWETPEGRRWLLKALNPNDVSVVTSGIPTLHSRNISVLNWQGEYAVDVPSNINAAIPNYDSVMFLYQHPLIFGMSAARPNGTMDLRDFVGNLHITRQAVAGGGYKYSIATSAAPTSPISMTRCAQYLNKQVDPVVFNGDRSLAGRRKLFEQLTQKNRIIYGGATIIPTCSSDNDSGTLAVCQQVFSPRKTQIAVAPDVEMDSFTDADFPNTSDLVQNPQMYYGRFRDGAYIPYKMNNPSNTEYVSSETRMTTRAPYFVENISFIGPEVADTADTQGQHDGHTGNLIEHFATCTGPNILNFVASDETQIPLYGLYAVRLYIQLYTGQRGTVELTLAGGVDIARAAVASKMYFTTDAGGAKNLLPFDDALIDENLQIPLTDAAGNIAADLELNGLYLKLPHYISAVNWEKDDEETANLLGCYYNSTDITDDHNVNDPDLIDPSICPYCGNSLVTIHMSGISNTAPIKMLLRFGAEILLVASSAYSPFKFMSPKYDESAIKSYARCIRAMKDAYFANAGSVVGQADYTNKLMTLIESDSVDDLNRTLNQGGGWSGVIGNY